MAVPPSLCQHCARFPRNATHHGHGGPRHPVRPLFSYWLALATTLGDGRSTGEEPTGVVRGLGWLVCFPPGQCTRVPLDPGHVSRTTRRASAPIFPFAASAGQSFAPACQRHAACRRIGVFLPPSRALPHFLYLKVKLHKICSILQEYIPSFAIRNQHEINFHTI